MVNLSLPKWLTYEGIVAGPDYSRWLFPPAALLIHFSIGQVRLGVPLCACILLVFKCPPSPIAPPKPPVLCTTLLQ